MAVSPIPAGYHSITPYLIVHDGVAALDFYQRAFGATEVLKLTGPDGKIAHAEIKIGDSVVMLGQEMPEMGFKSPKTLGGSPLGLLIYVPDVDQRFEQAIAAGGMVMRPVVDQFYGDRSGTLTDPFGHTWTIATHIEDLSQAQIDQRFAEMCKSC